MDDRNVALMFVLVLCVCGALLYLDWLRQGEIELLHERLDGLEEPARRALDALNDSITSRVAEPLVDRILRASDDRTFADIQREGAR